MLAMATRYVNDFADVDKVFYSFDGCIRGVSIILGSGSRCCVCGGGGWGWLNHRWAWGRQLGGGSAKFWPGGSGFWTPRGGREQVLTF